MENASYALRIAGGILIGVLVLSLLVAFYNNMRGYEKAKETEEYTQQVAEFNKQFAVYVKNLYGSDVLSLANKIIDYNRKETDKGYANLSVKMTVKSNLTVNIDGTQYGFKAGTYDTNQIYAIFDALKTKRENIGNIRKYGNEYISKIALKRNIEFDSFIKVNNLDDKVTEINKIREEYNNIYSLEKKIKSTLFLYVKSSYDETTGRMTQIEYTEKS